MERLDVFMTAHGLAASREKAKRLISEGKVFLNGKTASKAAQNVSENDSIVITETDRYVGRGAYKLLGAFEKFGLDVRGKVCADLGASTGGFTQVLLEKGAEEVYAFDVGHGQLAKILADDPRVHNCEGVNVRFLTEELFSRKIGFVCCDLSFISIRQAIPQVCGLTEDGTEFVVLIKPQFEAGRAALNKNGIVTDKHVHINVLQDVCAFFDSAGLALCGLAVSPIQGGDGNIEYLAYLTKGGLSALHPDIKKIVMRGGAQTALNL